LSEGIAETLINSFAQIPKLRVVQRSRAFRYNGESVDVQQAGRELQVQAVLSGRLLIRGETLIVKMDLIDVERDAQLWGQQYTKKFSDIFALQEEIAVEVADSLKVRLSGETKKRAARQTKSTEAYELYLKGRFQWSHVTPESTRLAIEYFNQAIAKDPNFARAYAGLADCYGLMGSSAFGTVRAAEVLPKAKTLAERALALDDSLGEAYTSLGACALFYEWNWKAAETAFRRSLELDGENVHARMAYSQYLAAVGRNVECLAEARRAYEIDPLSSSAGWLGTALVWTGNTEEGISAAHRALSANPAFLPTYLTLAHAHYDKGDMTKALEFAEKLASLAKLPIYLSLKGWLHAVSGGREIALGVLSQLQEMAKSSYVAPLHFATMYAGLGDIEAWRKAMLAAYDDRSNGIVLLRSFPQFKSLHSDPVFQEIVRRLAFP
jgi:TolB-like protein